MAQLVLETCYCNAMVSVGMRYRYPPWPGRHPSSLSRNHANKNILTNRSCRDPVFWNQGHAFGYSMQRFQDASSEATAASAAADQRARACLPVQFIRTPLVGPWANIDGSYSAPRAGIHSLCMMHAYEILNMVVMIDGITKYVTAALWNSQIVITKGPCFVGFCLGTLM